MAADTFVTPLQRDEARAAAIVAEEVLAFDVAPQRLLDCVQVSLGLALGRESPHAWDARDRRAYWASVGGYILRRLHREVGVWLDGADDEGLGVRIYERALKALA